MVSLDVYRCKLLILIIICMVPVALFPVRCERTLCIP